MRILDWNIEWMNDWFSGSAGPVWGSNSMPRTKALEAAGRAAAVIRDIGPDLICVQEGPSALAEMELFIADFLSDGGGPSFAALIGADGGAQKLYALARIGGRVESFDYATDPLTESLGEAWGADVDGNFILAPYDFTRRPLVVNVDGAALQPFRLMIVHTKSKFVQNGERLWQDPATRQQYVTPALTARRRISAEGYRMRDYLDAMMAQDSAARIIVTGDLNDGPGHDLFERSYLTHNVADIVLGSTFYPDLIFHHPLLARVPTPALWSARFDDFVDGIRDRPLLLDHFLVSPAMQREVADARIAHDVFDAHTDGGGSQRHQRPSDHRPIVLELA
jgi:hypothetical protein